MLRSLAIKITVETDEDDIERTVEFGDEPSMEVFLDRVQGEVYNVLKEVNVKPPYPTRSGE